MRTVYASILFIIMIAILVVGCGSGNRDQGEEVTTLTISAAVSLTDALEEIKEVYERENQVEITFNFGGSGSLAQQIQQGAPSDIFLSANQDWMDILVEEELIKPESRADIVKNNLALIASESSPITYESFEEISAEDVKKIAIGNPESVPAGAYTKETLMNLGMWEKLKSQFVLAKDVRQVLTYVETGNVDIGVVYESDALSSEEVKILAIADSRLHGPIIYPGAVIADTEHTEEATNFLAFLETDSAQEIWTEYGFSK